MLRHCCSSIQKINSVHDMNLQVKALAMCLVFATLQVRAFRGILRNKPTNSTQAAKWYDSRYGTDGTEDKGFVLLHNNKPYFQVDLQELYIVERVWVLWYWDYRKDYLKGAIIGVSKNGDKFFHCGQFPVGDPKKSREVKQGFPCSQAGPVRYLKVWHETRRKLAALEVEADGVRVPRGGAYRGILRNKPISSSKTVKTANRKYAIDGFYRRGVIMENRTNPYIQIDLQDPYIILWVFVTSYNDAWQDTLKRAFIGVSKDGSRFIHCGQWPHGNPPDSSANIYGFTLEFPCLHAGPVRYVKIWQEGKTRLAVHEVDAEGVRMPRNAALDQTMRKTTFRRAQNSTSVSSASLTHCAKLCRIQFCRFFSYSSQQHPNCLLADSGLTVLDLTWNTWSCVM